MARVCNEQDHRLGAVVPSLQGQAPSQRLNIPKASFCFDRHTPSSSADDRVPCPEIALEPNWHFGAQAQAGREKRPKAPKQRELCHITYRITHREGSKREIKPENRGDHHQRLKRDPRRHTALDPALFGRGYSDRARNLALCQTGSETSLPEFLADRRQGVASAPPTSIDSPLSCRHGGSVPEASSQLIIWPLIAAFSWHEYMRRARHASTSELPEILVA
jgi:hypothetical protein